MASASFWLVVIALLSSGQATPWNGPAQTRDASYDLAVSGWTPAPTRAPSNEELRRRQDSSTTGTQPLCGYTSGLFSNPDYCGTGQLCVTDSRHAALGCCDIGFDTEFEQCQIRTSCVASASMDSCDGDCLGDPFVLKCGDVSSQCLTLIYDVATTTVSWLQCDRERAVVSLRATAKDSANAPTASYFAITLPLKSSTVSTGAATLNTASGSAASTTTGAHSASASASPAPVGAIVGGIIGGLAVFGLIIVGGLFFLKRNKSQSPGAGFAKFNDHQSRPHSPQPSIAPPQYPGDDKIPLATLSPNPAHAYPAELAVGLAPMAGVPSVVSSPHASPYQNPVSPYQTSPSPYAQNYGWPLPPPQQQHYYQAHELPNGPPGPMVMELPATKF